MKLERDIRAAAVVWSVSDVLFLIHFFPVILSRGFGICESSQFSYGQNIFFKKKKKHSCEIYSQTFVCWLLAAGRGEKGMRG